MAIQTGNGSQINFFRSAVDTNFNDAILVLELDIGEQTRETLPYVPLATGTHELHIPGDFVTARQITAMGLFHDNEASSKGPAQDIEAKETLQCVLTFPTAGVTLKDDGHFVSFTGPNLVNNEIQQATCVFQMNQRGTDRGWTAPT